MCVNCWSIRRGRETKIRTRKCNITYFNVVGNVFTFAHINLTAFLQGGHTCNVAGQWPRWFYKRRTLEREGSCGGDQKMGWRSRWGWHGRSWLLREQVYLIPSWSAMTHGEMFWKHFNKIAWRVTTPHVVFLRHYRVSLVYACGKISLDNNMRWALSKKYRRET